MGNLGDEKTDIAAFAEVDLPNDFRTSDVHTGFCCGSGGDY